jgi:hypothetical protein
MSSLLLGMRPSGGVLLRRSPRRIGTYLSSTRRALCVCGGESDENSKMRGSLRSRFSFV